MIKPVNRCHSFTRWPADPNAVVETASVDVEFVMAMRKVGIRNAMLDHIAQVATIRIKEAANKILNRKK